jgi:hypothetical protein
MDWTEKDVDRLFFNPVTSGLYVPISRLDLLTANII